MAVSVCIVLRTPAREYHARMHDALRVATHACTLADRMLRSPPPAQSTRFPATCPRAPRRIYPPRAKSTPMNRRPGDIKRAEQASLKTLGDLASFTRVISASTRRANAFDAVSESARFKAGVGGCIGHFVVRHCQEDDEVN